jgi:acyl-CoA thioesterase FadM
MTRRERARTTGEPVNLIFRFVWILLSSTRRSKIAPLDTSRLTLRVLPNDLDFNLHMNNGRYLTVMDLGRLDLIIRNGLFAAMRAHGWNPVLAAARISYRRSLAPFQRYTLETLVLGWDEHSVYMEQRFLVGGQTYARATIRAVFISASGRVPTQDLAAAIGHDGPSPQVDPRIVDALRSRDGGATDISAVPVERVG